jgi:hypothetical protein
MPAGQAMQPDRRSVPVPVVKWPPGQSRQEVEAGSGWYFEARQEVHLPGAIKGGPETCHSTVKAPLFEEEYPSTMKYTF